MLEYYNQFLKTFKVRLKIDWILGLDYFWVWISKKFSEILLLLFDFYWYKLLWIWTLYYVYSISMCTNSKCTTLSAARKLVYFEGLLYLHVGSLMSQCSEKDFLFALSKLCYLVFQALLWQLHLQLRAWSFIYHHLNPIIIKVSKLKSCWKCWWIPSISIWLKIICTLRTFPSQAPFLTFIVPRMWRH